MANLCARLAVVGPMEKMKSDVRQNRLLALGLAAGIPLLIAFLTAAVNSNAGEIAGALGSLIGGIVGAGGAVWAVFLMLARQREEETAKVAAAVRTEVTPARLVPDGSSPTVTATASPFGRKSRPSPGTVPVGRNCAVSRRTLRWRGGGFEPSVPGAKEPVSFAEGELRGIERERPTEVVSFAGYRWLESIPLQRGVRCEPDSSIRAVQTSWTVGLLLAVTPHSRLWPPTCFGRDNTDIRYANSVNDQDWEEPP